MPRARRQTRARPNRASTASIACQTPPDDVGPGVCSHASTASRPPGKSKNHHRPAVDRRPRATPTPRPHQLPLAEPRHFCSDARQTPCSGYEQAGEARRRRHAHARRAARRHARISDRSARARRPPDRGGRDPMRLREIFALVRVARPPAPYGVRALDRCFSIEDLARLARRRLPSGARGYLEGGGEDEYALRRNRAAFDEL